MPSFEVTEQYLHFQLAAEVLVMNFLMKMTHDDEYLIA